jgi:acyl-coenzyme A synthetase/AMP-(fatty) acid ligase
VLDLLITAARTADPARTAVRCADGDLTWADVGALLGPGTAAGGEPVVLPVTGRAADVAALLRHAAAGRAVLVLDGAATAWERARTSAAFAPAGPSVGLCTSGTTGLPKVVEAPWPDLLANARAFAVAAGIGAGDVVWCGTPMHHRYCLAAGLLGGLTRGATVVLTPALGPADFTDRLLAERVTALLSVPYLYGWYVRQLERDPELPRRWSLRRCVAAGAPLPPELAARWRRAAGLPLVSHYGSTEDGQVTIGTGEPDEGVGRALPDREVRVATSGEVLVRRRGEHARPGDGWRATGDTGHLDARGDLHLVGRIGDRLNIAGRKVDPVEVEDVLRAHPAVADCAVAAVPGPTGDEVAAFLVADGAVADAELRRHLAAVLSAYKLPRRLVRVAEVPRSRTGKVRRGALVADLAAAAAPPVGTA